ncbi:MAG: glutamine--fructose-6-phosphate transaminase (isomerizing) [Holosporales bacterium]|jgi:glucosamine--fructose-6-phosphate aminotransferase (isomerizing)|nr:glutamine--fructose-6-phosphate transaminase (isomerizing) [Holosporales bacterium]
MCGIISVLSFKNKISEDLISALERLEYRGYDSAGIAYVDESSKLERIRSVGRVQNLKDIVENLNIGSNLGIGHTRWATHGKATERNAHPHICNGVAIVHNGIIENYQALKKDLLNKGDEFESETDSEAIAKLIAYNINRGNGFVEAFKESIAQLVGTFAIVAIYEKEPNVLLGAKIGSPMVVGLSSDKNSFYIASDAAALASLAEDVSYLEEGDLVAATKTDKLTYEILDSNRKKVLRNVISNATSINDVSKNGYETFMLKEIFEEAIVARRVYDNFSYNINDLKFDGVSIIACGTSYYAGLLAKYWIEEIAKIHVDVEIASEFRYRNPVLSRNLLYIFISQSGETIDTLYAMRLVKEFGSQTVALVNVEGSSLAREADFVIKTVAGTEVGVASTKAFIAQTLSLLLLFADKKNIDISQIESSINFVLNNHYKFAHEAEKIKDSKSLFYIGRGVNYPIALEGALKIKELSYTSAEGYPSGEIKHGPIAIIDENVYTVSIAPFDKNFEKTISNTQEILARNGKILLITTEKAKAYLNELLGDKNLDCLFLPDANSICQPFCIITAIHLLAYYTSKFKGHDVDKPRNLAKSVTVE